MRLSILALCLAPAAAAQIADDDLILGVWNGIPDVVIARPNGDIQQSFTSSSAPGRCQGASLTLNNEILTSRWNPAGGFTLFGLAGGEAEFDPASLLYTGDTAVLHNGNLLVVDQGGHVDVFSPAGAHIFAMGLGVLDHPWGLCVDFDGTLWVGDTGVGPDLFHFAPDGSLLGTFELGISPGDIVRSPDGTLWVIDEFTSDIHQFALDGTALTSFATFTGQSASGLAMEADGTLISSVWDQPILYRFAQDGTPLGTTALAVTGGVVTIYIPGVQGGPIGDNYCGPSVLNSSGQSGVISAFGSLLVSANWVDLRASQLPASQWGMFLNSQSPGFVTPPGSQGNLCLSGAIGRYSASILNSGASGQFSLQLDLTAIPTPSGPHAVTVGETWYFQAWYRDHNPAATSNFTDGISFIFQ